MARRDTAFPEDTAAARRRLPPLARLVRVGETHVGRGVFARRPLRSGLILAEVEGRILVEPPADSSYVMELPSGRLLDPAPDKIPGDQTDRTEQEWQPPAPGGELLGRQ